jgi:hypothetical protein
MKNREYVGIDCLLYVISPPARQDQNRQDCAPCFEEAVIPAQRCAGRFDQRATTSRASGSSMTPFACRHRRPPPDVGGQTTCPLEETVIVAMLASLSRLQCTHYSTLAYQVRWIACLLQISYMLVPFALVQHPFSSSASGAGGETLLKGSHCSLSPRSGLRTRKEQGRKYSPRLPCIPRFAIIQCRRDGDARGSGSQAIWKRARGVEQAPTASRHKWREATTDYPNPHRVFGNVLKLVFCSCQRPSYQLPPLYGGGVVQNRRSLPDQLPIR